MTNGKHPWLPNPIGGDPRGGPPDNADGVALPPPARLGGPVVRPLSLWSPGVWFFVAVPRSGDPIPAQTAAFFAGIVFKTQPDESWSCTYDTCPENLQNMTATVTGDPAGTYPLSNYYVAIYELFDDQSVQLPPGIVPNGLLSWTQPVPSNLVLFPLQVARDVGATLVDSTTRVRKFFGSVLARRGTPKA